MLSDHELNRYDRQILITGFGVKGQKALKETCVLVAGLGGLGSPIASYLSAAGIGKIKIVDDDIVEVSNLNRQLLHWDKDIGQKKVESAYQKLIQLNTHTKIEALDEKITKQNIMTLTEGVDAIMDAMDNFPTRFILNKASLKLEIPFIHGGVWGFEGRVTTIIPYKTACLRCFTKITPPKETPPVIGITPGIIGMIEATEAIKYITGFGKLL